MYKFEIVIMAFVLIVVSILITNIVTTEARNCDYELWIGEDVSRCGSQLDLLIESETDSIIVVDSLKPEPIGVLYFKSY